MNLLSMGGAYGWLEAWLYATVVAGGTARLSQRFVDEAVPPVAPGGRVIDVGCGDGQVALLLARRFADCPVTGIDLSPDMIARGRKRAKGVANLELCVGDALDLPVDSDRVALATTVASIKHWPDPMGGLRELYRVLEPGGVLCLLEANPECTLAAARAFVGTWRFLLPGTHGLAARYFRHVVAAQSPRAADLEHKCRAVGFVELQTEQPADVPVSVVRGHKPHAAA